MAENKIAMRPEAEVYMNLGTYDTPVWARCGDGWKKFDENPNAQTEGVQYINAASETTDTVSYSPQYPVEMDLMYTDPTIKRVYDVANGRKIGSDAVLDFLFVDKFIPGTEEGTYSARREKLAVAISNKGGTKKMTMSGNLNAQGDPIFGNFTPATKVEAGASAGTFAPVTTATETTATETTTTETTTTETTGTETQTEGEETTPTDEGETTT